jgi:hypothetical protein
MNLDRNVLTSLAANVGRPETSGPIRDGTPIIVIVYNSVMIIAPPRLAHQPFSALQTSCATARAEDSDQLWQPHELATSAGTPPSATDHILASWAGCSGRGRSITKGGKALHIRGADSSLAEHLVLRGSRARAANGANDLAVLH